MAAPLDYAGALIDALADDDRDAAVALQDLALDAAQGPSDGLGEPSPDVAARVRDNMTAWIRARMAEGGKCAACDAAEESRRETARLRESGEHHSKGDVWQGPSGHWFTITASGHVAPAKAPGGESAEPAATAPAPAADHPLASLKDTHGIDLTGLLPDAVEAIRQALAPAAKPKAAPKPAPKAAAETPPHLVAAADKVKALAQTANDPDVTREQIDAGLDALALDKLPLAELQALGRHLSRDPADLKTKAGAVKAIRRIAQDAKELLVRGGG